MLLDVGNGNPTRVSCSVSIGLPGGKFEPCRAHQHAQGRVPDDEALVAGKVGARGDWVALAALERLEPPEIEGLASLKSALRLTSARVER